MPLTSSALGCPQLGTGHRFAAVVPYLSCAWRPRRCRYRALAHATPARPSAWPESLASGARSSDTHSADTTTKSATRNPQQSSTSSDVSPGVSAALTSLGLEPSSSDASFLRSPECRRWLDRVSAADVQSSLAVLQQYVPNRRALLRTLRRTPRLLVTPLAPWVEFFQAYGLGEDQIAVLLTDAGQFFVEGSIFDCGRTLHFLHSLGLGEHDVIHRVLMEYPGILNMHLEQEIKPRVEALRQLGYDDAELEAAIWEDPTILCASDRLDFDLGPFTLQDLENYSIR